MFLHRRRNKGAAVQTYRSKLRISLTLGIVAVIGAGFVVSRIVRLGEPGANFWLVFPALLAISGLALATLHPWWRKLDDMQRTSQLVSWYWGGMAGGLVVLMALVAATGARSDSSQGALYLVLGQAAGFLVFLAGRWLHHRGPAAA
jgi:hypothetical protein